MSKKVFYLYNPHTLSYERVYPSAKKRIFAVIRQLLVGIVIGAGFFAILVYFIDSPNEARIKKENKLLSAQYEILSKRLDKALTVMNDIQQRDDNFYRVILLAEPLPIETRLAGINNPKRYEDLSKLSDADLVITATKKMDLLYRELYIQSKSFDEIVELSKTNEERLKHIPAIQPVSNVDLKRTASGFGVRMDPIYKMRKFHEGMDFAAPIGTPIYAPSDGMVVKTGWQKGYGNAIVIDHGFGYKTVYGHLSKILAKVGKKVIRGEEIGLVGNTGKSTGPHLHYEVHYKGTPVNPINYYFLDLTPEQYDKMIQIAQNQGQVMD